MKLVLSSSYSFKFDMYDERVVLVTLGNPYWLGVILFLRINDSTVVKKNTAAPIASAGLLVRPVSVSGSWK